jgi:hypothetical protein
VLNCRKRTVYTHTLKKNDGCLLIKGGLIRACHDQSFFKEGREPGRKKVLPHPGCTHTREYASSGKGPWESAWHSPLSRGDLSLWVPGWSRSSRPQQRVADRGRDSLRPGDWALGGNVGLLSWRRSVGASWPHICCDLWVLRDINLGEEEQGARADCARCEPLLAPICHPIPYLPRLARSPATAHLGAQGCGDRAALAPKAASVAVCRARWVLAPPLPRIVLLSPHPRCPTCSFTATSVGARRWVWPARRRRRRGSE